LVENLKKSDTYTMEFLWYTCHSLVEDMNLQRLPLLFEYLSTNFESPLRKYSPETSLLARKVMEIVYLMNVQGCQESFRKYSDRWSRIFKEFIGASSGDSKIILMVQAIRNKNLLQSGKASFEYWTEQVKIFLVELERRVDKMSF
jgi:hypothetical protein